MHRFNWLRRKRNLVLLGLIVLAVSASAAYAAWTLMNIGASGRAKNATLAGTISINTPTPASDVADMYPGGAAGSLVFSITNSGTQPLKMTGLHGTAVTFTSDTPASCPNSSWSWGGDQVFATPIAIPVGTTNIVVPSSAFSAGKGLLLAASAASSCQGIGLTVGGVFQADFST